MKKFSEENLLPLEASSPEELAVTVSNLLKNNELKSRFVSLAISGPQVLFYPFNLTGISIKEVKDHLMFEAVELLSLPADKIELDFQIFNSDQQDFNGFYVCAPKKVLQSYLAVLYEAGLIPVKVTASILAAVDSFSQKHKTGGGSTCLLDFSKKNIIYLAVFHNQLCYLLREILYETLDEAKTEVVRSLRSAFSKSKVKQFERFYFSGDLRQKDELISDLESKFKARVERGRFTNVREALCSENTFFSLNLNRNYSISLRKRRQVSQVANVVLSVSLGVLILLSIKILKTNIVINGLNASYNRLVASYKKLTDSPEAFGYSDSETLKNQLEQLEHYSHAE